jgi:glycine dehydrogenase
MPGMASSFLSRHLGLSEQDRAQVRAALGLAPNESLVERALPAGLLATAPELAQPATEAEVLAELRSLGALNHPLRSLVGVGYYRTSTPAVLQRLILESPAWYTAYTPYQPEISQGRLEALFTFQTMIADLTGLPVANASLLDEATAAAEAMTLCHRVDRGRRPRFAVDADVFPQVRAVLETRAAPLGIQLVTVDVTALDLPADICGLYVQQLGLSGRIADLSPVAQAVHSADALLAVGADPLALTLLVPPGELGADICVGSTQRFGVPLGYGGPHAAYMSLRTELIRQMPGRLVGLSQDSSGQPAWRLALVTREQHIRREKATSNICTAQVLPAIMAAFYAVYHGPEGLKAIAGQVHVQAASLADRLADWGLAPANSTFFDTLTIRVPGRAADVRAAARALGVDVFALDADTVLVSTDEATTAADLDAVVAAFQSAAAPASAGEVPGDPATPAPIPADWRRDSAFLTHRVFHSYHTELELTRYITRLAHRDYALDRGMIPLGSCTMKLNAVVELAAMTWPEFAGLHPFADPADAEGTLRLIRQLSEELARITGYDAVSLQPNAGSQGELAGLLAIRGYHAAHGAPDKTICLIPVSAHGTNAASAALAGFQVVGVATDSAGNISLDDLAAKLTENAGRVGALMLTYPSTHGVYEQTVARACDQVHAAGGQVYIDGANFNALVGWAEAGHFGGDVSHLNLHKTFASPHGGGGPGVGPVACRAHLAPYLPGHPLLPQPQAPAAGPVSAAPYGSPLILPIAWAYIRLLGGEGLREATEGAVLAANYVAHRLDAAFPVLYRGPGGFVAHECLMDLRDFTHRTGVTVDDIAKRLIDYGFHAPTMSFPVAGTLMIEPTESESLAELDRFCDAMLAIANEAEQVAAGGWPLSESPLRQAPHTAAGLIADPWSLPYDRTLAAYPAGVDPDKYWPPVRRVDHSYGDRHFVGTWPAED